MAGKETISIRVPQDTYAEFEEYRKNRPGGEITKADAGRRLLEVGLRQELRPGPGRGNGPREESDREIDVMNNVVNEITEESPGAFEEKVRAAARNPDQSRFVVFDPARLFSPDRPLSVVDVVLAGVAWLVLGPIVTGLLSTLEVAGFLVVVYAVALLVAFTRHTVSESDEPEADSGG